MKKGILGKKGSIHLQFGTPLNASPSTDLAAQPKQELIRSLCAYLDKQIISNYRLFKTNYIAADIHRGTGKYADHYTEDDR